MVQKRVIFTKKHFLSYTVAGFVIFEIFLSYIYARIIYHLHNTRMIVYLFVKFSWIRRKVYIYTFLLIHLCIILNYKSHLSHISCVAIIISYRTIYSMSQPDVLYYRKLLYTNKRIGMHGTFSLSCTVHSSIKRLNILTK